ncbi:MAG: energy transducer TonB [Bacteroidales bacterium]|jgi:protein TonB|nr:energy transducer TonB [Bacteroidales bacterium]
MKTKKSAKANLERKRIIFFEIGLILALAIVFSAFEYGKNTNSNNLLGQASWDNEPIEELLITFPPPEKEEIIEPEPIEKEKVIEELNVVENDVEDDDIIIGNEDDGSGVEITIWYPPAPPVETLDVFDYVVVEKKPIFPGGETALLRFIRENVKYPEIAIRNNVEGKVYVEFIIDEAGKVVDVKVLNDFDPYLSHEAERVVGLIPDWKPGLQRNKPVKVKFIVPIDYKLY